jgi:predicted nucleotidyltransferase
MFTFERNLDFSGSATATFEPMVGVLAAVLSKTSLAADHFMIVGAEARNLLHSSFGQHPSELTTTRDIDVALAMPSWAGFEQLSPAFPLIDSSKSAIRFEIEGVPVDVIPFGDLEDPKGVVVAPHSGQHINVLGYTRAFEAADRFILPHIGEVLVAR